VVKPVDSSAGKGLFVCYTEKELREKYLEALRFSGRKKVLVEECMTCQQVQMYYTIQDGYVSLSAMSDRYTNKEQRGLMPMPAAHIFPSKHLATYRNTDHQKVVSLIESMNIKNGILFFQSFIHHGRVCIHESGFRDAASKGHIIIKEMNGIDTVEMMLIHSLTGEMKGYSIKNLDKPEFDMLVCVLYTIARKGKIAKMIGMEEIATLPEIFYIDLVHEVGDTITHIGTLDQVISRIFIKANTKSELVRVIEEINTKIKVEDVDGKNMLLETFNPYSF